MAAYDEYNIPNSSGATFRSNLNSLLLAIATQNYYSGNLANRENTTVYKYQQYVDTSVDPPLLKQRNGDNSAWITLNEVGGQQYIVDGTNSKPGIAFASDTNTGLKRNSADNFSVVTNGTQRLTFDNSGKVGLNTASPAQTFHVNGTSRLQSSGNAVEIHNGTQIIGYIGNTSNNLRINCAGQNDLLLLTNGTTRLTLNENNATFEKTIKNGDPASGNTKFKFSHNGLHHISRDVGGGSNAFKVTGNAGVFQIRGDGDAQNTNNRYSGVSDSRLKENIVDASSQWDDIKGIRVRNYNFKAETGFETYTQIGVIAQELESVSPGLVKNTNDEDDDGNNLGTTTKTVAYSVLYMKAVKALQEAMDRIETLETKVAALEAGN